MSSAVFNDLVKKVVREARGGNLLREPLFDAILAQAPAEWCRSEPETVAISLRELASFCDWKEYGWAVDRLHAGADPDELHLAIERIHEEDKASRKETGLDRLYAEFANQSVRIVQDQRQFLQSMRDIETLMGFDEGAVSKLIETIGPWDRSAVPATFLGLLPDDVTFPSREQVRLSFYDHRIHLVVRELASRLGEGLRSDQRVIKQCGHVLAEVFFGDDEKATARLLLEQMTLLAADYVGQHSQDSLGLCWLGELVCWNQDNDLAEQLAWRVWVETANASVQILKMITAFFASTTSSADEWDRWCWSREARKSEGRNRTSQCASSLR